MLLRQEFPSLTSDQTLPVLVEHDQTGSGASQKQRPKERELVDSELPVTHGAARDSDYFCMPESAKARPLLRGFVDELLPFQE